MKKLALLALAAASASILAFGSVPQNAQAADACARKEFKTETVKAACEKGGQKEAKKVMKKFLSQAKKQDSSLTCKSCHSSLKPDYKLKPDALEMFKKFGGK
ncbi:hypothetical protein [Haliangium sp.]|uniref:hypothetical protein n=1 Tax=Haliangium sp. TaxID=2663208 RepID=UPI003D0B5358